MAFILRPYQERAVSAAVKFLQGNSTHNAIEVLPTGSGKSLIIANIVKYLNAPTLIFQPSKEILEQNFAKLVSYGYPATIYSASMNSKRISNITFATIGSVIRKKDLFREFRYVIVDECHFVNSKGGMYKEFLTALEGVRILGLTATPYRLTTDGFGGSILKFLTRTRPRIFHDLIFYIQNGELFRNGYLAKLQYISPNGFNRLALKSNSTGADYDDASVKAYYRNINFPQRVVEDILNLTASMKNVLVFTRYIEESQYIVQRVPNSAIVTGETPKKEREQIISGFRSGKIRVVCNCGVLVTGFDYPELECIVIAQPTMSLSRYYQMIGRGIRPHPDKPHTVIVDLCGNTGMFGKVEDLLIVEQGERSGKWVITNNGRQLTNLYYGERVGSTWK
jgi:DNA repair protein RadD